MHEILTRPLRIHFSLRELCLLSLVVVFGIACAVERRLLSSFEERLRVAQSERQSAQSERETALRETTAANAELKAAYAELNKEHIRRWNGERDRSRLRKQLERLGSPIPQEPKSGMMGSPPAPDSFPVADRLARKMPFATSDENYNALDADERAMIALVGKWIAGVRFDDGFATAERPCRSVLRLCRG